MINLVALGIEVANGGIQTNKGLYYSWDIRLSTFFLGLIFLALYYKKYHLLHELVRTHCKEKKYGITHGILNVSSALTRKTI